MIAIDTSVLVHLFRGTVTSGTRHFLELEADQIPFCIPTICCQELLQGARDRREWSMLADYLDAQEHLSPRDPWETHRSAAKIYFDCRRKGFTVGTIDCFIAAQVLEAGGALLHEDADFDFIQRVRPLRTVE